MCREDHHVERPYLLCERVADGAVVVGLPEGPVADGPVAPSFAYRAGEERGVDEGLEECGEGVGYVPLVSPAEPHLVGVYGLLPDGVRSQTEFILYERDPGPKSGVSFM